MNAELRPCPFCGCEMAVRSNRDWHRIAPAGEHQQSCMIADEDDLSICVPATEEMREAMVDAWNFREHDAELTSTRASLVTAERLLAERDQRVRSLERHIETTSKITNDLLVGNQSAWIEWRHGKGAEEAMVWVEGSLMGVGVPEESEPWARDPQAYYSANKSDPFPACFCGRPSNHLWMGQGFCSDAHYEQARAKAVAEADGKTGLPMFDALPDTEGGSCD